MNFYMCGVNFILLPEVYVSYDTANLENIWGFLCADMIDFCRLGLCSR